MALIDRDRLLTERMKSMYYHLPNGDIAVPLIDIEHAPAVDAVPVVRCKDCKHRPTGTDREDLEFPDDKCPCQCEDYWYNWKPADEWYCGNGELKNGDGNG